MCRGRKSGVRTCSQRSSGPGGGRSTEPAQPVVPHIRKVYPDSLAGVCEAPHVPNEKDRHFRLQDTRVDTAPLDKRRRRRTAVHPCCKLGCRQHYTVKQSLTLRDQPHIHSIPQIKRNQCVQNETLYVGGDHLATENRPPLVQGRTPLARGSMCVGAPTTLRTQVQTQILLQRGQAAALPTPRIHRVPAE